MKSIPTGFALAAAAVPAVEAPSTETRIDQTPTPPTVVMAEVVDGANAVSWFGATDDVAVAGYNIYRNDYYVGTVAAPSTSWVDTEGNPGDRYAVTSFDDGGEPRYSPHSVDAVAAVPDIPEPLFGGDENGDEGGGDEDESSLIVADDPNNDLILEVPASGGGAGADSVPPPVDVVPTADSEPDTPAAEDLAPVPGPGEGSLDAAVASTQDAPTPAAPAPAAPAAPTPAAPAASAPAAPGTGSIDAAAASSQNGSPGTAPAPGAGPVAPATDSGTTITNDGPTFGGELEFTPGIDGLGGFNGGGSASITSNETIDANGNVVGNSTTVETTTSTGASLDIDPNVPGSGTEETTLGISVEQTDTSAQTTNTDGNGQLVSVDNMTEEQTDADVAVDFGLVDLTGTMTTTEGQSEVLDANGETLSTTESSSPVGSGGIEADGGVLSGGLTIGAARRRASPRTPTGRPSRQRLRKPTAVWSAVLISASPRSRSRSVVRRANRRPSPVTAQRPPPRRASSTPTSPARWETTSSMLMPESSSRWATATPRSPIPTARRGRPSTPVRSISVSAWGRRPTRRSAAALSN